MARDALYQRDGARRTRVAAVLVARTHVEAQVDVLVADDLERRRRAVVAPQQRRPVDGVDVAQLRVLLEPHRAVLDARQTVQAKLLERRHLEGDQRVVVEELLAADHRQVGEDVRERAQPLDAVQQQVAGDLDEAREGERLVGGRRRVVDQQDLQAALDHRAVIQLPEVRHAVADVHAEAHWNASMDGWRTIIRAADKKKSRLTRWFLAITNFCLQNF